MSVSSEQVMDTLDSLQQQWTTFREQEFGGQDAALVASDRAAPPSHAANGGLPPHENGGAGPSQMPSQPSSFQAPVAASPSLALKTLSRQLLREVESTRQEYAKQNEVLLQETEVLDDLVLGRRTRGGGGPADAAGVKRGLHVAGRVGWHGGRRVTQSHEMGCCW